jgi:RHS repeat-associated protein
VHLPDGGLWRITEPGLKLRWDERDVNGNHCGSSCLSGDAYLYLEDGSKVHMDLWKDPPDDQRNYWVDYYTPTYVEDPYGRRTTLLYEQVAIPGRDPEDYIRLKQIIDPSGRSITITYNGNDLFTWQDIVQVDGSDGSWVRYTPNASGPSHVDYSDGTHADYRYDNTTYMMDTVCCPGGNCRNCTTPVPAQKLIAAWDTHAEGPMQSIYYQYKSPGTFQGQVQAEKQLASATPTVSPLPGVAVSTFTSTSCPTHPWSQSPDCPNATQTETRGDGPSRAIYLEQAAQHVPLVKRRQDFRNHIDEVYGYDSNNYLISVTDRNGNITRYTNESVIGNPTRITHPGDGTHVDYTYSDANNPYHIQTLTDERGKVTTYTRDSNNRISRIDYPADANTPASYETFDYNSFGQVWKHRRKNGAYEYAAYDGTGLVIKLWNAVYADYGNSLPPDSAAHITLSYYSKPSPSATPHPWQDRVQTVTYPATGIGQVPSETYEYDRAFGADGMTNLNGGMKNGRGLVTKITHADNTYQTFKYDAYGNKRWRDNELRNSTSYTYDDYKRLLTVTDPLNKTTRYTYNSTNGGSSFLHTTNNPDTDTTPTGIVTKNTYDANLRKTSSTAAYGTALAATTSFVYDNVGNLTQVTDPRSKLTVNTYDTRNRKTSTTEASGTTLARTITWHYDEASNIYQIDRPDSTQETKTYDALNRVRTGTVPQTSSVNLTTTFVYNPSGTIASVTDANNHATSFAYDASDQKITMTYPDGSMQQWAWDDVHNPKWRFTVNNEIQYFYYDNRNRLYATWWYNWNDSSRTPDWRYFGYDNASRVIEAENGTGGWGSNIISDVHRFYDAADHLTLEQQNVNGLGTISVNYPTYNDDGKLTRMNVTGVSDYDYTFSYDAMGRFEKIFITNSSQLFQYYYDAASNETQRNNVYDGVQQIYPRDDLNRMLYLDVKKGANTLGHEGYVYDSMNRSRSVTREDNKTDSFTYYLDGELNTAQYNTTRSINYALDKAGNRTSVVDNGARKSYSPNPLNQYTTGHSSSVTNGPEHEISDYQGVHYTYINDERLKQASAPSNTYTLAYDALGRCVKRTLNGTDTYYIYDGEKPILEYNANGTRVGFNLYGKGIDEILERGAYGTDNAWHWSFCQQDHEGSVTHLTDAAGNVMERYRYDAFGAPTIYAPNWTVRSATIYDNRFLFTGREYAATYRNTYTAAFNFYEYRARVYNATLGRFMSEDPKLFAYRMGYGTAPGDWSFSAHPEEAEFNLFRYCGNDPLDFTDPMGEVAEVTVDGTNISIRIPIKFTGLGVTQRIVTNYTQTIQRAWTGQFGEYHVTAKVDTSGKGVGKDNRINKIEIVNNQKHRSYVVGSQTGKWNNSGDKFMPGHEAGHLMGLRDRYKDVKQPDGSICSMPNRGYENNIMANMAAKPSAQDIGNINKNTRVNDVIVLPHKTILSR